MSRAASNTGSSYSPLLGHSDSTSARVSPAQELEDEAEPESPRYRASLDYKTAVLILRLSTVQVSSLSDGRISSREDVSSQSVSLL